MDGPGRCQEQASVRPGTSDSVLPPTGGGRPSPGMDWTAIVAAWNLVLAPHVGDRLQAREPLCHRPAERRNTGLHWGAAHAATCRRGRGLPAGRAPPRHMSRSGASSVDGLSLGQLATGDAGRRAARAGVPVLRPDRADTRARTGAAANGRAGPDRRTGRPAGVSSTQQDAKPQRMSLPGGRHRGGEPENPGPGRPRPLPHPDRGRHRHGGRRRLRRPGPGSGRDPRPEPPATASPPASRRKPLCAGAPVEPAPDGGFDYAPAPFPGWWRVAPRRPEMPRRRAPSPPQRAPPRCVVCPRPAPTWALASPSCSRPRSAAAAEARLAGLPLVELPVPGRAADGGGLFGRRRLARHRQGHRRAASQASGHPGRGRRQPALLLVRANPRADRRATSPPIIAPLPRGLAAAGGDPGRLLVRRRHPALRLQPPAPRRAGRMSTGCRCWRFPAAPTSRSTSPAGWASTAKSDDTRPTAPELARLPPGLVQCFYGADDADSACQLPELKGAELIRTEGGHHFDGDYDALADDIADLARQRRRQTTITL